MANLLTHSWFIALLAAILIGAVLSAVHHAEVIAHKTGEPFGTLVLSISVTIIEVSLIIAMMLSGHRIYRSRCGLCHSHDCRQWRDWPVYFYGRHQTS